jgi:Nucleotidyl transferase AbiEii toxin, Type IV TA system
MPNPDTIALAALAAAEGLETVLVGGNAVNLFAYSRTTFDVDLLVREQDAERWLAFFKARGYAISRRTPNFIRLRFAADPSGALPVDLMLVTEETYRKIQSESLRRDLGNDLTLAIPSVLHLIAMKLHALHNAQRVERGADLQDVRHLIKTARIDISSPAFTAILDRYATDEIRRLIQSEFGK